MKYVFWFIGAVAVQMGIVWIVTLMNKDHFDSYPAAAYSQAVKELARMRPRHAWIIRLCYAASIAELLLLFTFVPRPGQ